MWDVCSFASTEKENIQMLRQLYFEVISELPVGLILST
jgi:hypothetical protein